MTIKYKTTPRDYALVDEDDYEELSEFYWSLHQTGRALRSDHRGQSYMHRIIAGQDDASKTWVRFKNGDKLDCRKENLFVRSRYDHKQPYWRYVNLFRQFGLEVNDYEKLVQEQGNRCAICGKTPEEKQEYSGSGKVPISQRLLAVDHCHTEDRVRGLLCWNCNVGLGHFKDNPEFLEAAAEYLRSA